MEKELKFSIDFPTTSYDLERILELIEENIVKYVSTKEYIDGYSIGEILLAKNDDKIIGFLMMRRPGKVAEEFKPEYLALKKYGVPEEDIGFIIYLVIDKAYQGRGMAGTLIKRAIEMQREWGAKAIGVHCWQGSPGNGSEKAFAKAGFKPVKMHKAIWAKMSKEMGPKGYWCVVDGNPCHCDELEMFLTLKNSSK